MEASYYLTAAASMVDTLGRAAFVIDGDLVQHCEQRAHMLGEHGPAIVVAREAACD